MKIFISHSGDRSRELAEHVASFVKQMIQATDPWISTGMDKGLKWLPEIAANLEASSMGIVCLTKENLPNAWILFESGALAKRLNDKVCTLVLDVDKEAVDLPLGQFQGTKADDPDDVWKLVATIAKSVRDAELNPPSDADLEKMFREYHWPKFAAVVEKLKAQGASIAAPRRSVQEALAEVVTTVREFSRPSEVGAASPDVLETLRDIAYYTKTIFDEHRREWHRTQGYAHALDRELYALRELRLELGDGRSKALAAVQAVATERHRKFLSGDSKSRLVELLPTAPFALVLGLEEPTEKDS